MKKIIKVKLIMGILVTTLFVATPKVSVADDGRGCASNSNHGPCYSAFAKVYNAVEATVGSLLTPTGTVRIYNSYPTGNASNREEGSNLVANIDKIRELIEAIIQPPLFVSSSRTEDEFPSNTTPMK